MSYRCSVIRGGVALALLCLPSIQASTVQKEVPAGEGSATFNRVRLLRGAGRLESWVTRDDRRIGMLDVTVTRRR